jgi:TolB-like protein/tetratricopeptide (TPR) repeat protein
MATGQRPFEGQSSVELASAILRDTPAPLSELRADLPDGLARVIGRCMEKNVDDRLPSARDLRDGLRGASIQTPPNLVPVTPVSRTAAAADSGSARADEGFWVAVLPFKYTGADADLKALADGLSEEIVTGLSRFSYLRVVARSSTLRYASEGVDVRAVGEEIGARFMMEGSLRQAGVRMRLSVQLVDAVSGAHLWAETYDRSFSPEKVFELQDDLVPRIVSTVADMHGILPRSLSEAVRGKPADQLTPYEALLHGFGYNERFTPEALAEARTSLEKAVREAPDFGDCWALLSLMYSNEYGHWDNRNPEFFDKALQAARAAVLAAPLHSLSYYALAQAHFFRREFPAARTAAERAVSLNPMDGATAAFMGLLIAYSGKWERGCALAERSFQLNPNLPGLYHYTAWHDAYGRKDYRRALELALQLNTPDNFYQHAVLAMCYAQLGEMEAARKSLQDMLALKPDYAEVARELHGKWIQPDLVEQLLDGLRKAGLDVPPPGGSS